MYNKKNSFNIKTVFLFILISLFFSMTEIYGDGSIFTSLGYSPGMTDHYRTDMDPHTHTYKEIPLALDLYGAYLFKNNMGVGLDVHWGIIDKMIIENEFSSIVLEDWEGTVSQLNFSPQFLYAQLRTDKMTLILGMGISYTMNFYLSEYGNDLSEHYFGISFNSRFNYFITEYIYLSGGLRFNIEFLGIWDSELISNIFQTHYYPLIALGIRI